MTEENKKENIKAELDRASTALDASTLLFENGFLNDAISRLYYFMLHTIRALLLTIGLEPKSHEGVLRVFGLHFIKHRFSQNPKRHNYFCLHLKKNQ